eukprot:7407855-Heterocapsa_arctica.AAC.1
MLRVRTCDWLATSSSGLSQPECGCLSGGESVGSRVVPAWLCPSSWGASAVAVLCPKKYSPRKPCGGQSP